MLMVLLSFAKQHLCMLHVDKRRWMPALIFDGYDQAQTSLSQLENFEGKDKMQDELAGFLIVRSLSNQSISGRLAVVLGDMMMKRVILGEEQICQIENFNTKLFDILRQHPQPDYCNSPVWKNALTEALTFLNLTPTLPGPSCVDSSLPVKTLAPLGDKVVSSLVEQEFPNDEEQESNWEDDVCSDCDHVVDHGDSSSLVGTQSSKLNRNGELDAEDGGTTTEGSRCTNVTTHPPSPRQDGDKSMDEYDQWIQQLTQLVQPHHCWQTVKNLMRGKPYGQGLTWKHCRGVGGVESRVYMFPGRQGPKHGGKLNHDFVYDEFYLKKFVVDTFNWNGDDEYLQDKETQDCGGRRRRCTRVGQTLPPSVPKRRKVQVPVEI
jgi:hypothetical protein